MPPPVTGYAGQAIDWLRIGCNAASSPASENNIGAARIRWRARRCTGSASSLHEAIRHRPARTGAVITADAPRLCARQATYTAAKVNDGYTLRRTKYCRTTARTRPRFNSTLQLDRQTLKRSTNPRKSHRAKPSSAPGFRGDKAGRSHATAPRLTSDCCPLQVRRSVWNTVN